MFYGGRNLTILISISTQANLKPNLLYANLHIFNVFVFISSLRDKGVTKHLIRETTEFKRSANANPLNLFAKNLP